MGPESSKYRLVRALSGKKRENFEKSSSTFFELRIIISSDILIIWMDIRPILDT